MPDDCCGAAVPRPPDGGGGPATLRVELGGGGAAVPAGLLGGGGLAVAEGLLGGGGPPVVCVGWLAGTVTLALHDGHANDCPAAASSTVSSVRQVGHANFRSILGLMHQQRLLGEYGSYDANSTTNHAGA